MAKNKLSKAIGDLPGASPDKEWTNSLERGRKAGPRMEEHKYVSDDYSFATKVVHSGTYEDPIVGSVGTPIFQNSTFLFSEHTYEAFFQGISRDVPIYTRYGNPTQWAVQEKIAQIEGAESCVVFSSGMAAISTTLIALSNRGGNIISAYDVYGGTYNLLHHDLHQLGRSVTFVEATSYDDIVNAVNDNTQILFFETLTNPLLKAIPLVKLAKFCKDNQILLVVDNTFLSPYCSKPLQFGADIVIHSCTKFLNGHSDLTAGCASGSRKYVDRIWEQMLRLGGHLEPFSCFLLERSLKTLDVRMQRHVKNSEAVAKYLDDHPKVKKVYHPTTKDYQYPDIHEYASSGFGGLVSFEVEDDATGLKLMDELKIPAAATSLGGVESLISMPFNTSHSSLTEEQRASIGINPGLIRFSLGIEGIDDILEDLESALDRI